jgi:hypothetical protein
MQQRAALGAALALCGGLLLGTAAAEEGDAGATPSGGIQVSGGLDLACGMATGPLASSFDHGWGALGRASVFRGRKPLALALEGWIVEYGRQTVRRPLFADSDRVLVDVATTNWIGHLSLGPELAARSGRVRPYARALVGFSYFATSTLVEGSSDVEPFATTTHLDDFTLSGALGAGVRIPFKKNGLTALDLHARYVISGEVEYLVEGDIHEASDGRLLFEPRRTQANLVVFGVGLTFGR